jgi:hypothetical protein
MCGIFVASICPRQTAAQSRKAVELRCLTTSHPYPAPLRARPPSENRAQAGRQERSWRRRSQRCRGPVRPSADVKSQAVRRSADQGMSATRYRSASNSKSLSRQLHACRTSCSEVDCDRDAARTIVSCRFAQVRGGLIAPRVQRERVRALAGQGPHDRMCRRTINGRR